MSQQFVKIMGGNLTMLRNAENNLALERKQIKEGWV